MSRRSPRPATSRRCRAWGGPARRPSVRWLRCSWRLVSFRAGRAGRRLVLAMKIAPRRPGAPVAARLPGGARCGVIGACRRGGGPAIVDAVAAGWTAAARRLALALAAAVLLGGCTGGRDARTSPAAPEAPGKAAWRRLAPAPSERTEVAATAVGTLVYVVGGFRDDG